MMIAGPGALPVAGALSKDNRHASWKQTRSHTESRLHWPLPACPLAAPAVAPEASAAYPAALLYRH
eukprot:CAMPEP_0202836388 /NCGR_PEP_ID=MMETSP1389-20130828/41152_1 /ASSEMBLY_ACC=CAM_ASM_000865 /TAXON_ID=302021 /ORGANISM="Rhodomonas sp., Strain CCMP768" /LENGTH=65 /DNA_ID=CAMNT_0049512169 /DNA_START=235 /DNA_END=432 /DNA_ORIENTATION=+